ncbi:MAG: hypothetical protein ACE14M_11380 [Terriglobales bacterium]
MLALRLVRLIEGHSQELASSLAERLRTSSRTTDYLKIPAEELRDGARRIYEHLSDWLLNKTESDVELHYLKQGMRRFEQGIRISDFVWAIIITKENLWRFLQTRAVADGAVELYGELELIQLLDQFFDRALYYATVGYERARHEGARAA